MKKILLGLIASICFYSNSFSLEKCEWDNRDGKPCLTIFSAPNTSKITEGVLGKTVTSKKQIIESGYEDVRSV